MTAVWFKVGWVVLWQAILLFDWHCFQSLFNGDMLKVKGDCAMGVFGNVG